MSVREQVQTALEAVSADDWRATLALTLAAELDAQPNASMARELRALMSEIAESSTAEVSSVADDLRARRAARIAKAAGQ